MLDIHKHVPVETTHFAALSRRGRSINTSDEPKPRDPASFAFKDVSAGIAFVDV